MLIDLWGNTCATDTENLGIPYMGSKRKHADKLMAAMLQHKPKARYFYDLFGGGGAMSFAALQMGLSVHYNEKQTDLVDFMRFIFECIANPKSEYGLFPADWYRFVSREDFMRLRGEAGLYPQFVRICYSFGNNQKDYLFNRELEALKNLAHDVVVFCCAESLAKLSDVLGCKLELSDLPDWNRRRLHFRRQIKAQGKRFDLERLERLEQLERLQQLEQLQQLERLQQLEQLQQNIAFSNLCYQEVKITTPIEETIVYLDPPYRGTEKYVEAFDYDVIDDYFANLPYLAFMSEYNAPFECVHEIATRSTLSASNNAVKKIEKLYVNHV